MKHSTHLASLLAPALAFLLVPVGSSVALAQTMPRATQAANATADGSALQMPAFTDAQGDRATQALNLLEAHGYAHFTHFRAAGTNFAADVGKDGKSMQVIVNPDTGRVSGAQA